MSRARTGLGKSKETVISLALTWDGARWPVKSLPAKARAFLAGKRPTLAAPNSKTVSRLLGEDHVRELRICWVPRLKGGEEVLSEPVSTLDGKRIGFRVSRVVGLDGICGVIYRRARA